MADSVSISNANLNTTIYLKGDVSLLITPFDVYRLFTIYTNDTDGTPLDISNVGTLYLTFGSSKKEIKIKECETTKYDKTSGQVVFHISAAESKKILALTTSTYYITAKQLDDDGTTESAETMLYTGKWSDEASFASASLSSKIRELQATLKDVASRLSSALSNVSSLSKERDNLYNTLQTKNARITELENEVAELESKLSQYEASMAEGELLDSSAKVTYSTEELQNKYLSGGVKSVCVCTNSTKG